MNLWLKGGGSRVRSIPRVSGGEPTPIVDQNFVMKYSPRERG